MRNKTKEAINNIYSAKNMLVNCQDEYNVGMYNGMEYALSVLENREPEYFVAVGEEEAEQKEVIHRTIATGIKRR